MRGFGQFIPPFDLSFFIPRMLSPPDLAIILRLSVDELLELISARPEVLHHLTVFL